MKQSGHYGGACLWNGGGGLPSLNLACGREKLYMGLTRLVSVLKILIRENKNE